MRSIYLARISTIVHPYFAMTNTIPAPADQAAPVVELDQVRAAARFGTIGFNAYAAAVLAESARLFAARTK